MNNTSSIIIASISQSRKLIHPEISENCSKLEAYKKSIDVYNAAQSNSELLDAIRKYNHAIINSLNGIRPLSGSVSLM